MTKYLSYALPSVGESILMSLLIGAGLSLSPGDFQLLGYLLPLCYCIFLGVRRSSQSGVSPVPIENSRTGRYSVGAYIAVMTVLLCCCFVILEAMPQVPAPEWYDRYLKQLRESALLPTILTTVIAAPVLEEFFCRGVILRGLLTHLNPSLAVIISSALFAALHMSLFQAIPAMLMGLFFGWVYYKTHSLITTTVMHIINNAISLYMLFNTEQQAGGVEAGGMIWSQWWPYVLMVAVAIALFVFYVRQINKNIISDFKLQNNEKDNLSL